MGVVDGVTVAEGVAVRGPVGDGVAEGEAGTVRRGVTLGVTVGGLEEVAEGVADAVDGGGSAVRVAVGVADGDAPVADCDEVGVSETVVVDVNDAVGLVEGVAPTVVVPGGGVDVSGRAVDVADPVPVIVGVTDGVRN